MITAKLVTLIGAAFESAAYRRPMFIDLAGVWFVLCAVVHAGPRTVHLKRHLTEMAFFELVQDVQAPQTLEAHEVFCDYEDRTRSLEAASAAFETIKVRRKGRVGCVLLRGKPSAGGRHSARVTISRGSN